MSATRGAQGPGHGGPTCPGQLASRLGGPPPARVPADPTSRRFPAAQPGPEEAPAGWGAAGSHGAGKFRFSEHAAQVSPLANTLSRGRRRERYEEPSLPPTAPGGGAVGGRRRGGPRGCAQSGTGWACVCVCTEVLLRNGEITEHRGACRRRCYSATSATPAAC